MRITRLHILMGFIGLVLVGYGIFTWMQRRAQQTPRIVTPRISSSMPKPVVHPVVSAARTIATIGEAYRALPKPSGEIPSIAHPLRLAKDYLASGQTELAMTCARNAWIALKNFKTTKEPAGESYEVVKGDTLWRIARDHSPVHQGPGWVTIWKANKEVVKNFNRIEVGWDLTIPNQPSSYIEPYWKPRQLASARQISQRARLVRNRPPASLRVDLPEVLAWAHKPKTKNVPTVALRRTPSPRPEPVSLYAYLANQEARHSSFQQASFSVPAPFFSEPPQYH